MKNKKVNNKFPKWILVEDQLPKKGNYNQDMFIVSIQYRDGSIERWVSSFHFLSQEWESEKLIGGKVIAWMPLPKPYKPS